MRSQGDHGGHPAGVCLALHGFATVPIIHFSSFHDYYS